MLRASDKSRGKSIKGIVTDLLKTVMGASTTVGYSKGHFRITIKDTEPGSRHIVADRVMEVLRAAQIQGYSGEALGHKLMSYQIKKNRDLILLVATIHPEYTRIQVGRKVYLVKQVNPNGSLQTANGAVWPDAEGVTLYEGR